MVTYKIKSKENSMWELSTATDRKSPIWYYMKYLSDLEIWMKPDLPPGMAPWINDSDKREYDEI